MAKIRLLLVEAREVLREGFVEIFKRADNIEVIAICTNYEETIRNAGKFNPDIILIGTKIVGGDRTELVHHLKELYPDILVTMIIPPLYDYYFEPLSTLDAGVDGYISGGVEAETLFEEITNVYWGHTVVSEELGEQIYKKSGIFGHKEETEQQIGLSKRELEVLSLIAEGLSNSEIAQNLCITKNTVKAHLSKMFKKMRANSRQQALSRAIGKGILTVAEQK